MDYRFTDNVADPVGVTDHLYTEKLIRIPNGFLCYQGDDSIAFNNMPPCVNNKFITFGSFNNLHKVTNQVIEVWSKILLSVPNSCLIIKSKNLLNKTTRSNLLNKFKCEGISTDRITLYSFLPTKKDHLALYDSIDIALDTFPYNGTTTTCEALWMGIPVVTFLGKVHSARVGGSILTQIKLEDLVANDVNMYINTSIKLAKNIEDIIKLRKALRSNMKKSTLCNAKLFTKHIETEYQRMYKIDK
jgi:predicted O-linked N-acetylglucosamine transferase (SPINDLY family)